jgi:hypothetical protein
MELLVMVAIGNLKVRISTCTPAQEFSGSYYGERAGFCCIDTCDLPAGEDRRAAVIVVLRPTGSSGSEYTEKFFDFTGCRRQRGHGIEWPALL